MSHANACNAEQAAGFPGNLPAAAGVRGEICREEDIAGSEQEFSVPCREVMVDEFRIDPDSLVVVIAAEELACGNEFGCGWKDTATDANGWVLESGPEIFDGGKADDIDGISDGGFGAVGSLHAEAVCSLLDAKQPILQAQGNASLHMDSLGKGGVWRVAQELRNRYSGHGEGVAGRRLNHLDLLNRREE